MKNMNVKLSEFAVFLDEKGYEIYNSDGSFNNSRIKTIAEETYGGVYNPAEKVWVLPFDIDLLYGKDIFFILTKLDIKEVFETSNKLKQLDISAKDKESFIEYTFYRTKEEYEMDKTDLFSAIEKIAEKHLPHYKLILKEEAELMATFGFSDEE